MQYYYTTSVKNISDELDKTYYIATFNVDKHRSINLLIGQISPKSVLLLGWKFKVRSKQKLIPLRNRHVLIETTTKCTLHKRILEFLGGIT